MSLVPPAARPRAAVPITPPALLASSHTTSHEGDAALAAQPMIDQTVTTDTDAAPDTGAGEITFVRPIPGFPALRRWALTRFDGEDSSLWELVSLERPEIRFMVATAYSFFPGYDIELGDDVCEDLSLAAADDVLVLVVLTVSQEAGSITANLLAPVVINARTRGAALVILSGSVWPVRAPLD